MDRNVSVDMTVDEALMLQHLLNAIAMNSNENGKRSKMCEDMVRLSLKVTHALLAEFVRGKDGKD